MTDPTDAEIVALAVSEGIKVRTGAGVAKLARAVLAKWGAQPVPAWYALVPVEPTPEMVDAAQEAYMPFGDMQLAIQLAIAAAPQPVACEPLTDSQPQAGAVPQCWCLTCRPMRLEDPYSIRMALCPTCGNKRCPKANDHRNECTGSNEPGQPGSAYAHGIKGGPHGAE